MIVMTRDAVECPLEPSTKQFSDLWPDVVAPSVPTLRRLKQDRRGYEAISGYPGLCLESQSSLDYRLKSHF